MKNLTLKGKLTACLILICLFLLQSCRKETLLPSKGGGSAITIAEAKSYFETNFKGSLKTKKLMSTEVSGKSQSPTDGKLPMWDGSTLKMLTGGTNAVLVPIHKEGLYIHVTEKKMVKFGFLNYMMMYKNAKDSIITEWVELKPSVKWIEAKFSREYDGKILVRDWYGKIKKVYSYANGTLVPTVLTKINTLAAIGGSKMSSGSSGTLNCFVTTTTTITTIPAKPCPCDGHTWGQVCNCYQFPTNGGTTINVEVTYDCDVPDDPIDPPTGSGSGGTSDAPGSASNGGSPNPSDYGPINCNPDPNYTVPTVPPPPGTEYILPCSSVAIPTEGIPEPTEDVTNITSIQSFFAILGIQIPDAALQDFVNDINNRPILNNMITYLNENGSTYDNLNYIKLSLFYQATAYKEINDQINWNFEDLTPGSNLSLINNGIIVSDLMSSSPPLRQIAVTRDRGNTEDLQYGTNHDASGVKSVFLTKTNPELYEDMASVMRKGTSLDSESQQVAIRFMDLFYFSNTNNNNNYSDPILNRKVSESAKFNDFMKIFGDVFRARLKQANGNINNVSSINLGDIHPVFSGKYNMVHGLTILLNDTEHTKIELLNFSLLSNGIWEADFQVTILDHFGLDRNDAVSKQHISDGFPAWWVLQHRRAKVPFITKVIVKKRLTGSIN